MTSIFGPQTISILARIIAFCTAIPFHEAAHAFVSNKLGDPTAKRLGRLTLNPIKHLDPMGFLAMLTIGVGWAKPVPINTAYYKNRKVGMAISSAAGPLSNFFLAFIIMILSKLTIYAGPSSIAGALPAVVVGVIWQILNYLIIININLAIFNLLPIPPLDGSRIFLLFLPNKAYFDVQKYERYIMIGMLALIFLLPMLTGFDPISWLLGSVWPYMYGALNWLTGFIDFFAGTVFA